MNKQSQIIRETILICDLFGKNANLDVVLKLLQAYMFEKIIVADALQNLQFRCVFQKGAFMYVSFLH